MNTIAKPDVLIVGAGPTGLALACQLIRYGVDFLIVDKREGITPYSKAIGVQARTLEIYQQIELAVFPLGPRVAEIFGSDKPFTVLLRPDNYIAFVSSGDPLAGLRSYFNNVIRPHQITRLD